MNWRQKVISDARGLAEALGRVVLARDYPGVAPYIVFSTEARIRAHGDFHGLTSAGMDLALRLDLEQMGRWRGRAPACLLNIGSLLFDLRGSGRGRWRQETERRIVATSLHEWGHVLAENHTFAAAAPTRTESETTRNMLVFALSFKPSRRQGGDIPGPLWEFHNEPFLRAACHLAYRSGPVAALAAGALVRSDNYDLSPMRDYAEALRQETELLADLPIGQVLEMPAPPAFTTLWQSDVGRWLASLPEPPSERLRERLAKRGINV